uniref:Uncharacterized protein n=1 Tax=Accipiter nisus TaxID=211598 RepID=A0A8B9NM10_9AVES
ELLELDFLLQFRVEHTYRSPVDFLTTQFTERQKKRVNSECPENEKLPQEWTNKSSLQKLIILRALCPDRMTYALGNFVEENLGSRYKESTRMDFAKSYEGSSPATPVFFILSPGTDPLEDIETLGKKLGFTVNSGRFCSISLGQGQGMVAEEALEKAARHGHLVLSQVSLGTLEKLLEQYSEESHPDFHYFFSTEPHPFFLLCYFHSCIAGRLKFGPQGWNGRYPFSARDLAICITVLGNNLETPTKVPWEDLHYLFGDVMYGGHITDAWDPRLCCMYLAPGFLAPPNLDYAGYYKYIDEMLPSESLVLYGLHPNTEMGYLTTTSDNLFKTLLEMQPMNSFVEEGSGQSAEEKMKNVLDDILELLPKFNMAEIMQNATAWSSCALYAFHFSSKGELMFSPHMQVLQSALFYDAVPDTWTSLAYLSIHIQLCPLASTLQVTDLLMWYGELDIRTGDQLCCQQWCGFLACFFWLSALAVMQSMACKNNWSLDKVCLTAAVTKKTKEDYGHPPWKRSFYLWTFHGSKEKLAKWVLVGVALLAAV